MRNIVFTVEETAMPIFLFFVQREFGIDTVINCSVHSLLCDHLGIESDYLSTRIQTIFLNGETVDDVNLTIVGEGDRLTLSAAMPGVLGAMLRKGGHYAAMRSSISHKESGVTVASNGGRVNLKLFNLIIGELGPNFLDRGIWVKGKDLKALIERNKGIIEKGCKGVFADGKEYECHQALQWNWDEGDEVLLQVKVYEKGDEKEKAE